MTLPSGTVTFLRSDIEASMEHARALGARYDELAGVNLAGRAELVEDEATLWRIGIALDEEVKDRRQPDGRTAQG